MARLTKEKRESLPASDFAGPHRSYPVDTPARARAAAGLAGMHHASEHIKERIHEKAVAKGFSGKTLGSGTHGFTHGHSRKMC